ncbi:MAG: TonB-dependent receptor [Pseudomonadota bacterium]
MSFPKLRTALSAALLAGTSLTTAHAQGADFDEVIVTAQKREQSLQDVPASVAVLADDVLDNITSGGEDILALSARVPSLYAESSFGRTFPRFYIRGLGNTDFDLNANQPVSLVYDGVVLENPILKGFPVFDLDQIEVLRGPQGTLFGRNTPAGAVTFTSAKPTQETEGYVRAAYGRFDTVDLEGAISGALVPGKVAARLSGIYQRSDDRVVNSNPAAREAAFEEFDDYAARLLVEITPDANSSYLINVHGRRLRGGSRTFFANAIQPGTNELVANFDRFVGASDSFQVSEVDNIGVSLTADWNVWGGTLTSISAFEKVTNFARGDVDGGVGAAFLGNSFPGFIPFPAESADGISDHGQYTQELRFNTNIGDTVNLTVGGFAFHEDLNLDNISYDSLGPGNPLNALAIQTQETTSLALFGSLAWNVTDRLTATGGLRVTDEDKDFSAERLIGPFGAPPLGPITRELGDTVVTGDFALDYALTDDVNVYARYARGFRAPNAQGRILFGDFVTVADTETIDSVEAGFKSRYYGGRVTLNGSLYYFETDDQQLTAVGGAGNFNQLLNAEAVRGQGFEIDAGFIPFERFELTAGLSYNDTEIIDPNLQAGACGAPCTVLDPIDPVTGLAFIDGNPLPNAPKWIANATARYSMPITADWEAFVFADVAHRSSTNFFLYESTEFSSDPLTEVGLRGGFATDDFEIAGYVRNLTGVVRAEGGVDFNNLTAFVNEPTLYAVEVTKRF